MLVLILWLGCAALGYVVGQPKNRGGEGVLLGLLLGFIGVIIIACLKPKLDAASPAVSRPGQWLADPYGRHQLRWYDGTTWMRNVSDHGVHGLDELGLVPEPAPVR